MSGPLGMHGGDMAQGWTVPAHSSSNRSRGVMDIRYARLTASAGMQKGAATATSTRLAIASGPVTN